MEAKSCSPHRPHRRPAERSDRSENVFHRPVRPRGRCFGLNPPFFHPKEQYHHPPQVIAEVGAPVEVGSHISFDSWELKKLAMFCGRECYGFLQQRPEWSAEPVVRGNVETDLFSFENRRSELTTH